MHAAVEGQESFRDQCAARRPERSWTSERPATAKVAVEWRPSADIRYRGQASQHTIPFPNPTWTRRRSMRCAPTLRASILGSSDTPHLRKSLRSSTCAGMDESKQNVRPLLACGHGTAKASFQRRERDALTSVPSTASWVVVREQLRGTVTGPVVIE